MEAEESAMARVMLWERRWETASVVGWRWVQTWQLARVLVLAWMLLLAQSPLVLSLAFPTR